MSIITEHMAWFITIILCLLVCCLIIFIVMSIRYAKLRKSYIRMLNGSGTANIEDVLIQSHEKMAMMQTSILDVERQIEDIKIKMKGMVSHVGVHRYNAYEQHGSDLSFSIALVDKHTNGIVLTGLHSREQTYLYAKGLEKGDSVYPLSPEEKHAINLAVNKEIS